MSAPRGSSRQSMFGANVTVNAIHEVARSAFIGLMLILLPIFFFTDS